MGDMAWREASENLAGGKQHADNFHSIRIRVERHSQMIVASQGPD